MLTDWSVNTPASSPPQEGFSGLIERSTFHSEETGFAVLRVKVRGHRELVTVVGVLASVNAGEWITTQGNWVQDKERGLQFKATFLKCSPPTSPEGIEKYYRRLLPLLATEAILPVILGRLLGWLFKFTAGCVVDWDGNKPETLASGFMLRLEGEVSSKGALGAP